MVFSQKKHSAINYARIAINFGKETEMAYDLLKIHTNGTFNFLLFPKFNYTFTSAIILCFLHC